MPNVVPAPLRDAIRINHEDESTAATPPPELDVIRTAEAASLEPKPLNVDEAVPIQDANRVRDEVIRRLIEAELPQATAQQKEVWFESLRDMQEQDVTGILRMWKMLGNGAEPGPVVSQPSLPVAPEIAAPLEKLVREAVEIHRRNLLCRDVPGYVPHLAELGESRGVDGTITQFIRATPAFPAQPKLQETGFPLDLAIEGMGLFVVQSPDGETFYTRNGRFSLDDQRRLGLKLGDDFYRLFPELPLQDFAVTAIEVSADGQVTAIRRSGNTIHQPDENREKLSLSLHGQIQLARVLARDMLEYQGAGLFKLRPGAEEMLMQGSPGTLGWGTIRSGSVELADIDPVRERAGIERWEQLLRQ